jgi:hypothetical protein
MLTRYGEVRKATFQTWDQHSEAAAPAFVADKVVYRIVVIALGLVTLGAMSGANVLTAMKVQTIPDVVTALGAAAIGALAGLLVPSPTRP